MTRMKPTKKKKKQKNKQKKKKRNDKKLKYFVKFLLSKSAQILYLDKNKESEITLSEIEI